LLNKSENVKSELLNVIEKIREILMLVKLKK